MGSQQSRRPYESVRRKAQAMETRAEIARAARRLFVEQGWAATTIRDVAREAGVSVPTVYSAYQNKNGLIRAIADAAGLSGEPGRMLAEMEAASASPAGQLAAMVGFDRRLYEGAGDVIVLVREAGRSEPDLAKAYTEGRKNADKNRRTVLSSWPKGTLRSGLDLDTAIDIYAGMCNIDAYRTFIDERGWSADQVEAWWREAVPRELLNPER